MKGQCAERDLRAGDGDGDGRELEGEGVNKATRECPASVAGSLTVRAGAILD